MTDWRDGSLRSILAAGLGGIITRLRRADEMERATDALIAEAGRQVGLQYQSADAHDLKTLGMMAGAIATAAFVASAQTEWRTVVGVPVWTLPLLLLVLSV